jgi:hypothetical protein
MSNFTLFGSKFAQFQPAAPARIGQSQTGVAGLWVAGWPTETLNTTHPVPQHRVPPSLPHVYTPSLPIVKPNTQARCLPPSCDPAPWPPLPPAWLSHTTLVALHAGAPLPGLGLHSGYQGLYAPSSWEWEPSGVPTELGHSPDPGGQESLVEQFDTQHTAPALCATMAQQP